MDIPKTYCDTPHVILEISRSGYNDKYVPVNLTKSSLVDIELNYADNVTAREINEERIYGGAPVIHYEQKIIRRKHRILRWLRSL